MTTLKLENEILPFFISLQANIQLFHWSVEEYNKHVISNELYNSLLKSIDLFVEVFQGDFGKNNELTFKMKKLSIYKDEDTVNFLKYLKKKKIYLGYVKESLKDHSYLVNILDDMITAINKAIYKLKLK
jgi:hypothetical protein